MCARGPRRGEQCAVFLFFFALSKDCGITCTSFGGWCAQTVGTETFRIAHALVDGMITVSNDEICAAIKSGFEDTRCVLEPVTRAALQEAYFISLSLSLAQGTRALSLSLSKKQGCGCALSRARLEREPRWGERERETLRGASTFSACEKT